MEVIDIKYFNPDIIKLQKIYGEKSDWIDLRSSENVQLKKGELKTIRLGVGMKLPKGYEAIIAPRSSTAKNFGIIQANSIGVMDNSYSGDNDEWMFLAYAIRDTEIHVNDRIAQFRIIKNQPLIIFNEVPKLGNIDRGAFGSTGTV